MSMLNVRQNKGLLPIALTINQLCRGIIVSEFGFGLSQRTPFRIRDIRFNFLEHLHTQKVKYPSLARILRFLR